jgi:hypothetical protein
VKAVEGSWGMGDRRYRRLRGLILDVANNCFLCARFGKRVYRSRGIEVPIPYFPGNRRKG